ncbi:hypothetical protein ATEG_01477 [Aspergillus terreus NIH2624]|uniref:Dihydroorotate dehydrogenase (quinone), mitochondrial n=1 Tax=Aspergillus terreus (strain NIH 2624 / FGSC A1156) TaxID=341663 RepID=Q0CXV7_ASPTN|nr:uncharacterized protein ATEG_01477 [Aspergillus terreus NIH2624]EAU38234.1 hypothetical protein ATEG_01477 [Aspergillus terreus NIH2624]
MAANAATLAWRTAGARARAVSSLRYCQRPSVFPKRNGLVPSTALRHASDKASETAEVVKEVPKKAGRGFKRTVVGTSLALAALVGYVYATDTRASVHRYGVVPLIRLLYPDAEDAHHIFGYTISNPIGISAGLDKHAEIPDPLFALGPAIVEVGGTTPLPQEGNPRPRVFRLPSQRAMINRYGLNSKGADHMAALLDARVRAWAYAHGFGDHEAAKTAVLNGAAGVPPGSLQAGKLLAVQVAKNKATPDGDLEAIKRDYVYCVDRVAPYADIVVVNVSSPNTPGLRDLQATAPLTAILRAVVGAAKSVDRATKPVVMVKTGGYSGPQLFDRTVALVARYRALLDQGPPSEGAGAATGAQGAEAGSAKVPSGEAAARKVLFASGGITNGQQARAVLDAGASVAMMYTGVVYGGVGTVTRVKQEMRGERLLDLAHDLAHALHFMGEAAQEHAVDSLPQAAGAPQSGAGATAIEDAHLAGTVMLGDDGADALDDGGDVVDASGTRLANGPDRLVGEDDGRVRGDGLEHGTHLDGALIDGATDGLRGDGAGGGDLANAHEGHHIVVAGGGGLLRGGGVGLGEEGAALGVAELDDGDAHVAQGQRRDLAGVGAQRLPEAVLGAEEEGRRGGVFRSEGGLVAGEDLVAGVDGQKVRDEGEEELGAIGGPDDVVLGVEEGPQVVQGAGGGKVHLQRDDEEIAGEGWEGHCCYYCD